MPWFSYCILSAKVQNEVGWISFQYEFPSLKLHEFWNRPVWLTELSRASSATPPVSSTFKFALQAVVTAGSEWAYSWRICRCRRSQITNWTCISTFGLSGVLVCVGSNKFESHSCQNFPHCSGDTGAERPAQGFDSTGSVHYCLKCVHHESKQYTMNELIGHCWMAS